MHHKSHVAAKSMRSNVLRLAARAGAEGKGAHIAPSLSMVEILAVLFTEIMSPQDLFVLSKGHGGLAYYTALKETGFINDEQLNTFETDGGSLPGQPSKSVEHGIVFSSGSLGMGLSYACGLALASKKQGDNRNIYVLLGDGELNEGSNWEAIMLARQHNLDNVIAVVDYNGMQSDGMSENILDVDLERAFRSFGWQTEICNGHSVEELRIAFCARRYGVPLVVLAKTTKGKGVSFMENDNTWHHNRLGKEQYIEAMREVEVDEI